MRAPGNLVACVGCARHVRTGEGSCPFCGAALLAAATAPATASRAGGRVVTANVARAAIFAGALVACDPPAMNAAYGGPPPFSVQDDAGAGDAGAAPIMTATPAPFDTTSAPAPVYGGPPPPLEPPPAPVVAPPAAPSAVTPALTPDAGARRRQPR